MVDAVKATGRKKLIIAGLWTEICVAMPAIQALGEGCDVFVVTDASGGVSAEAHDMAVRAWSRPARTRSPGWRWRPNGSATGLASRRPARAHAILQEHGGASGIAFAWELQLLATPSTDGAGV